MNMAVILAIIDAALWTKAIMQLIDYLEHRH